MPCGDPHHARSRVHALSVAPSRDKTARCRARDSLSARSSLATPLSFGVVVNAAGSSRRVSSSLTSKTVAYRSLGAGPLSFPGITLVVDVHALSLQPQTTRRAYSSVSGVGVGVGDRHQFHSTCVGFAHRRQYRGRNGSASFVSFILKATIAKRFLSNLVIAAGKTTSANRRARMNTSCLWCH